MEQQEGLQSKVWDGYFDMNKDSIMGSWHRCMICSKVPSEIYHDSDKLYTIWHCKSCSEDSYKPKNILQKILIAIDKKIKHYHD
jgi:hypothetical protein